MFRLDDFAKEIGGLMCYRCRHYHNNGECTCDAFSDEIPDEVWHGEHYKPYSGDNGVVFDELSEKELKERDSRLEGDIK